MTAANPVSLRIPGVEVDLQLQVHGSQDQVISQRLRETGIWEPYETRLVLTALQEGAVFVDVGANLGYFSVLAAARVGEQGYVYAFEPDPDNFALLERNIKSNGFDRRVCAVQAALAGDDGQGMLFLSENNLGDHQVFDVTGKRRSHPVALLNGSEFLSSRANTVDLLKIDTQGSEHAVMMGLLPYVQQLDTPPRIIVELTPLSLRQAGTSGRALIDSLAALNQPFWIIDHIEHALAASDAGALAQWCDNVDACEGDEGFMNILVGPRIEGS